MKQMEQIRPGYMDADNSDPNLRLETISFGGEEFNVADIESVVEANLPPQENYSGSRRVDDFVRRLYGPKRFIYTYDKNFVNHSDTNKDINRWESAYRWLLFSGTVHLGKTDIDSPLTYSKSEEQTTIAWSKGLHIANRLEPVNPEGIEKIKLKLTHRVSRMVVEDCIEQLPVVSQSVRNSLNSELLSSNDLDLSKIKLMGEIE